VHSVTGSTYSTTQQNYSTSVDEAAIYHICLNRSGHFNLNFYCKTNYVQYKEMKCEITPTKAAFTELQ